MELDYSKIDNELLPALDDFPALEIDRGNIKKIRALLLARAPLPSAVTVKEEELNIELIYTQCTFARNFYTMKSSLTLA